MTILNRRTIPVEEDQALIKHVIFFELIDLHTNPNTDLSVTGDIDEDIDVDSYSLPSYQKITPETVRVYDLVHDNSNATGITFPPHGNTQFETTNVGRKFGAGARTDGSSYMIINDHDWFDATDHVIAGWFKLPATAGGDGIQTLYRKDLQIDLEIQAHATAANSIRCRVWVSSVAKEVTFTYTPDTFFSIMVHADTTNITIWEDNSQQGQTATGGTLDTNSNNVGIFGEADGTELSTDGVTIGVLTVGDKDINTDTQWRADFQNGILDWNEATNEETTTIPFIGNLSEWPNAKPGTFIAP